MQPAGPPGPPARPPQCRLLPAACCPPAIGPAPPRLKSSMPRSILGVGEACRKTPRKESDQLKRDTTAVGAPQNTHTNTLSCFGPPLWTLGRCIKKSPENPDHVKKGAKTAPALGPAPSRNIMSAGNVSRKTPVVAKAMM